MKSVDFNDVYSEHAEMIYRLLMRMCNDEHLAEDLLQDTFLKAIEKIDTFDMRCKLSSWLCQIAKNTYFDYYRKKKNPILLELCEEQMAEFDISPENKVVQKETMEEIIATIHNLDEPYKEVFWLRFYGEMSYKEIGSIFGKSEVWGRVTYSRTKEMILRRIKDGDMD